MNYLISRHTTTPTNNKQRLSPVLLQTCSIGMRSLVVVVVVARIGRVSQGHVTRKWVASDEGKEKGA